MAMFVQIHPRVAYTRHLMCSCTYDLEKQDWDPGLVGGLVTEEDREYERQIKLFERNPEQDVSCALSQLYGIFPITGHEEQVGACFGCSKKFI